MTIIDRSPDAESRRAAVLARYGSLAAASAPCEREAKILAAIAPWRRISHFQRRTTALDGWSGHAWLYSLAPRHVTAAIAGAYPMPSTISEAAAEHAHWEGRNSDLGAIYGAVIETSPGRYLDLVTDMRAMMVRDLAEHGLAAQTVDELRTRFALFRARGARDGAAIEAAMARDIDALAQAPAGKVSLADQIAAALRERPEAADREIARTIGCAAPTVAKVRRSIGLADVVRSVRRGGQAYPMKARGAAR